MTGPSPPSDTHLPEEDVGGREAGRHGGAGLVQRGANGPVDQLGVLAVVVLQHHGRLQLLGVLAQQQAGGHVGRAHRHLAQSVQQTHLVGGRGNRGGRLQKMIHGPLQDTSTLTNKVLELSETAVMQSK